MLGLFWPDSFGWRSPNKLDACLTTNNYSAEAASRMGWLVRLHRLDKLRECTKVDKFLLSRHGKKRRLNYRERNIAKSQSHSLTHKGRESGRDRDKDKADR